MNDYRDWVVPVVAVLLTLFLLYLLGLFTANVFGRADHRCGSTACSSRLPLVKTIYRSTKQIVMAIGGFQSMYFQRVVLVEFPAAGHEARRRS